MEEDACIERVDAWIKEIKKSAYETNINSQDSNTTENPENPKDLRAYISSLEDLEHKLNKAIINENTEALIALEWPNELMECITDIVIRGVILDHLQQAFTINHFNKFR